MTCAHERVEHGMPVKRAARLFGVHRPTLRDQVAEYVKHGTNPGPAPYLTNGEEQLFSRRSKSWIWKIKGRN